MEDCASRINGRLQITTDAHKPCLAAVEKTFGGYADYAQLHKIYGATEADEAWYSPATNGFSKKVENYGHAVALYFAYYNFCRVHQTLRVTPAMEAGLADHVWSVEELISLLPEPQSKKRGPYQKKISN